MENTKQPEHTTGSGSPCSAAFARWTAQRGVRPRLTHEEVWRTAWEACAAHVRERERIQIVGCPRCDHEFEAEIVFESIPATADRSGLAGMTGSGELEPAMQEYEHAIYAMRKARKRAGKLIAKDRRFHRIKSGKVAQLSGIPLSIIEKIEMGSGGNADDMWRVIKAIAVLKTHKGMTKENIFPNRRQ